MADDIGSRGEDPRDVARRRLNIGRRLREGQVRTAESQASGPRMTPSTQSMVPYREGLPAGGGRGGGGEGSGSRSMAPSGGDRPPAPRSSSGELMRQGAGMGSGASRAGGSRVVGGAGPMAAAGLALGLGSEALRRYMANRGERPIEGEFEQGMEPEGTAEAASAETERQRAAAPPPRSRPRTAARAAPRESMSADDLNEIVLRLNRGEKPVTETEKRLADRMGIAYRKGGMVKPKTAMKKGGAVKAPAKKMKSGGKVAAPKKMMKGGMTSKPKKMMGGGRAMYAKGGMARGCK